MARSKAMSTAKLVISGEDLDVTSRLIFSITGDLLLLEGCDEEFPSSRVTNGCMLEVGTWNCSSRQGVVSTAESHSTILQFS